MAEATEIDRPPTPAAQAIALSTVVWWGAILVAAAWLSSHWLLRSSSFWDNRSHPEVQQEQRHADYAYRLAVDPPAAKELRMFGLVGWTIDRFIARRIVYACRRAGYLLNPAVIVGTATTFTSRSRVLKNNVSTAWFPSRSTIRSVCPRLTM